MPRFGDHRFLALVILAALAVAGPLALMRVTPPMRDAQAPRARLSPEEVVRLQLEALQHNDEPTKDHGIAVVYGFASPQNKARSGSLAHFTAMIHDAYADMLHFRRAVYLPGRYRGGVVFQPVVLLSDFGASHYVFVLSRQDGEACSACWLTDAVIKLQTHGDAGTPI